MFIKYLSKNSLVNLPSAKPNGIKTSLANFRIAPIPIGLDNIELLGSYHSLEKALCTALKIFKMIFIITSSFSLINKNLSEHLLS